MLQKPQMASLAVPTREKQPAYSTRLVSPEGVKLTIDQAVRMIQFIDATNSGEIPTAISFEAHELTDCLSWAERCLLLAYW